MLCFLQIVGTVAIKFVPREVIVWISSGSAQNHSDYRVSHGNPTRSAKIETYKFSKANLCTYPTLPLDTPVLTEKSQVTSFH